MAGIFVTVQYLPRTGISKKAFAGKTKIKISGTRAGRVSQKITQL